jgi:hypothetical protein
VPKSFIRFDSSLPKNLTESDIQAFEVFIVISYDIDCDSRVSTDKENNGKMRVDNTFSLKDLDQGGEMIIFESNLTTFKASNIF